MGVAGGEEDDSIQRRYVDAFGEAADVREDAALFPVGRRFAQPCEEGISFIGFHGAVNVAGEHLHGGLVDVVIECLGEGFGVFVKTIRSGFRSGDFRAEGDGFVHEAGVDLFHTLGVFVDALGESIDDADEFHSVGGIDFFLFVSDGGEDTLWELVFHAVFDGQDEDFVVSKEAALDGFAEADAVEFFAVEGGVVHGAEDDRVLLRFLLGSGGIEARGRGHVEAFLRAEEIIVMHFDEVALIFPASALSCGAMGFVADDEVEVVGLLRVDVVFFVDGEEGLHVYLLLPAEDPLGFGDGINGLVGGEDDNHAGMVLFPQGDLARDGYGIRRRGLCEVDGVFVAVVIFLLRRGRIAADADRGKRLLRKGVPFIERLVHEGDGGDEDEDKSPLLRLLLGEAERSESLPCAARHDEAAAVMGGVVLFRTQECLFLVRKEMSLCLHCRALSIGIVFQLFPVDGQIRSDFPGVEGVAWDLLMLHRIESILPQGRGGYKETLGESDALAAIIHKGAP